jgi:chemotaxis protein MotB
MSKSPFDDMDPDVQAMRASMRNSGGPTRWGRVLTGVLLVACATFALAYHLPLQRAHAALTSRFAELQTQVSTAQRSAEESRAKAKELGDKQQALESQSDQAKQNEKTAADASLAIKTTLQTKLEKPLAKEQAALGVAGSRVVATLSLAYVLSPGKLEVSPLGKAALCSVASAAGERSIRVVAIADKKSIPPALAPKLKTPLQYSVAAAEAVTTTLLDKCNASPARTSATGLAAEPAARPQLEGKKLSGARIELWLESGS